MKNPFRKNMVGFFLLAFLLSAFLMPPGVSAQVEEKGMPQVEGPVFIWYSGDRGEKVWLDMGEVVVLPVPSSKRTLREDVRANLPLFDPHAEIIEENEFRVFLKVPPGRDLASHESRIEEFNRLTGLKSYPVFYPGRKDSKARMALTGEIIVHFRPEWNIEEIDRWAKKYDLTRLRDFSFSPNTYSFYAGEGLRSLHVANEIYLSGEVIYAYPNWLKTRVPRAIPDDPLFMDQWHLQNSGQGGGTVGEDVDIVSVWDTYGGSTNEVIAIVDDGLEIGHEDLSPNMLSGYHWDYVGGDSDPTAGEHGTSVAGVAAARGWNDLGVTGAAPYAALVGYRLLGANTDTNEADALARNNSIVDIYSNSWGPTDGGTYLEEPGPLTKNALVDGVTNGRGGRGNIYVFAGGNGGNADNSNYDGYANSRYTIAVAASTNYGTRSSYSEKGANLFVNAPSNGGSVGITTTDRTGSLGYSAGNYTDSFGGTSSAAPLVSGIIALVLQANPNLTWRDVQHILITTSEKNDPTDPDWTTNGAGFDINHQYGFGRVNAQAGINAAASWTPAGPETTTQASSNPNLPIPDNNPAGVSDTIDISDDLRVEYVDIFFSASNHTYWGDLQIELTSPSGTKSVLAEEHSSGSSYTYDNWRFGSVRHFGESSAGTWTLSVKDLASTDTGTFQAWGLKIYGTLMVDTRPPTGSVLINNNNAYTKTTSVTLGLSASDPSGVSQMCLSNTASCSLWEAYTTSRSWVLPSGDGTKTLYAWFEDSLGNANTTPYSDSIVLDTGAPSDGTLSCDPGDGQVALRWSGFSDSLSGINGYQLVYSTTGTPESCSTGTQIYSGSGTSYRHRGLTNGTTYTYRICARDNAGNISTGVTANATPQAAEIPDIITLQSPSDDAVFDSCSLITGHQPKFRWTAAETFSRYKILFSISDTNFTSPIVRANIRGIKNHWTPPIWTWKNIMITSHNNGVIRDIYWKVVGEKHGKAAIESEVRSLRIGDPQTVTIRIPMDGDVLSSRMPATFEFYSNCNVKFRLEFSSTIEFNDPTKIRKFIFTTRDPNLERVIRETLISARWTEVKRLIGTGMGYFRIMAWDDIGRETSSEVRSFIIQ